MRLALFVIAAIASSAAAQERLTLDEAIARGLEKNADIVIERESLAIADAALLRANAAYEPALRGDFRYRDRTDPVNSILSGAPEGEVAPQTRSLQSSASLVRLIPTGASISFFSALNRDQTDSVLALLTPSWSTLLGAEIRQPLMQNRRIDPARRAIRIARADRSRADSSLRRIASEIVAAIERSYWNVTAARRGVSIRESNLRVAGQQRDDTRIRVQGGVQPEADLSQTDAEVERRRGDLLTSRENLLRAENALRSLIARDADDPIWTREIATDDVTASADRAPVDLASAIAQALAQRPELEELQHRLERQDVEIAAALDRVRPQLDLLASYNGRGLAGNENDDAISPFGRPVTVPDAIDGGLERSLGTIGENRFPDATIGVSFTIPLGNTAAKQDVAIARAIRRQSEATLAQARQRVAYEVRNAAAALDTARQRIEAAEAGRKAAEIQLQAERDRLTAGASTTFFILTRQNDLAAAQLAEVVARTDYRKADTELARATGSLLEARGIEVRGSR
ncbi:MAG: TolC family protein [Thermoanaerobaculia bacterium]|nr:TolC family protein [Thermoanaerobaculia bacterium]